MKFVVVPILDRMAALYRMPRTPERFKKYLAMLQGDTKDDMVWPIAAYNPMGNDHVLRQIQELQYLHAEALIENELNQINQQLNPKDDRVIALVINLADDVGGAWSNYYTTDYTSKFDINALVKRNFCVPHFWTSETFTGQLIVERVKEYVYRTLYWINNTKPTSLQDFVAQEVFVGQNLKRKKIDLQAKDWAKIKNFYLEHADSDNYSLIFNFFYGDEASEGLHYPSYGLDENAGFEYVKSLY